VVDTQIIGNSLVIKILEERIDLKNFDSFIEILKEVSSETQNRVVLDMENVDFLDSSGLGSVLTFCRELNNVNRDLRVANCSSQVLTLFNITELSDKIPIFDNVEEAVK